MGARTFDEDDIRGIVTSLEHPTIATRKGVVVTVNDAFTRALGFSPEDVEGTSITTFLSPEERERLTQRTMLPDDAITFDKPLSTIARTREGRVVPVVVFTSRFHAATPPDFRVTLIYVDASDGERSFARELLALSAELVDAKSDDEVHQRTRDAFVRAGFTARFLEREARGADIDERGMREATTTGKPIFVGSSSPSPDAVYVPISSDEVLLVAGPGLSGQHAYTFGFFSKLVSTALLELRASEAARRKLKDTQLVLQLARTTSESLDLDAVMSATADSLVQLLDVSSCFILLYDERRGVLLGKASSSSRRHVVYDLEIGLDDPTSIAAEAARSRTPIVIPDTRADARARRAPRVASFEEMALAALPIVSRGRLEGVVMLDDTRGPRAFDAEWIELATAMVGQVGLSISNARLFESLRKSYDELGATRAEMVKHERLAGLGELAAIVAHEVRNPVSVIYNASSSLRRLVETSRDGVTLVDIVREECERLNHIVGDLIDFARPRKLSRHPEAVPRLLTEVAEALGEVPNVTIDVGAEPDVPLVLADRRLLRQALVNVAQNAVQAMAHGGTLRLRASAKPPVTIEIADNGPGIPPSDLPRIFEPFFTTKATGSGLGLALVKRIVEDHGGQISVSSSPNGTTFRVLLPAADST